MKGPSSIRNSNGLLASILLSLLIVASVFSGAAIMTLSVLAQKSDPFKMATPTAHKTQRSLKYIKEN